MTLSLMSVFSGVIARLVYSGLSCPTSIFMFTLPPSSYIPPDIYLLITNITALSQEYFYLSLQKEQL